MLKLSVTDIRGGHEGRMLGRFLGRMADGATHVSIALRDGSHVQGEIESVYRDPSYQWRVRIYGPAARWSDIGIRMDDILRVRTTARRHCAWCKEGW